MTPETLDYLELIWSEPGEVHEVRILDLPRQGTASGYFDSPEAMADAVAPWDGKGNIYVIPNPLPAALMARRQGGSIIERPKTM